MKVLLINPPSPFLLNPMAFPPLGLLYLGAALEESKVDVEVVDIAYGESPLNKKPDFIGISVLTPHIPFVRKLIPKLKEAYPKVPVIVGGAHITAVPNDAKRLGADAFCVGDGEYFIKQFVNGLGTRKLLTSMQWYVPARHLLDLSRYKYKLNGMNCTSMITSRGCPYNCHYCSAHRSRILWCPREILDKEIVDIKSHGYNAVQVYDDEVNLSWKRLRTLCELMKKHEMTWRGFIRANLFNRSQAKMMAESGCVEVCCGVESGMDEILKRVNKKATAQQAYYARWLCKKYGLRFKAFMMIGLPGESEWTVMKTKQWLLGTKPDDFDISPFTPYPGSTIAEDPEKFGIVIEKDYWDAEYFHKGVPGKYRITAHPRDLSIERLLELRDEVESEVRAKLDLPKLEDS